MKKLSILSVGILLLIFFLMICGNALIEQREEKEAQKWNHINLIDVLKKSPDSGLNLFKSLRGEAVVINIWATWCGPCTQEIPELNLLAKQFQGKPVRFIALNKENEEEEREKMNKRELEFEYELAFISDSTFQYLQSLHPQPYGQALPLHIVVNPSGNVALFLVGASRENIQRIRESLRKMDL